MQEYLHIVDWKGLVLHLVDWKGLVLPSTEKRCKAGVKKFERSPITYAEWIALKESFAEFQVERVKSTSDDKGFDIMISKSNARGNQTQAQWSFAAEAWLEVTYGILSPTC